MSRALLSGPLHTAAAAAAAAASNGSKDAAYIDAAIAGIGANPRRRVTWGGLEVFNAVTGGPLTRSGTQMLCPAVTANAIASASVATGSGIHRIEKADDANVFIQSVAGNAASTAPARMTANFVSGAPATLSAAVFNGPGFDTVTAGVDEMVAHMGTTQLVLPGGRDNNFMKGGYVGSGGDMRSVAVQSWWPGNRRIGSQEFWTVLQPWFVGWDIEGHQAGLNTLLEVSDLELWGLIDGQSSWTLFSQTQPSTNSYGRTFAGASGGSVGRRLANGRWGFGIEPTGPVGHGYDGQVGPAVVVPSTLRSIHVRVFGRKVLNDPGGPDDRAQARYALQAGCDLYPFPGARLSDTGMPVDYAYWPGAVSGRFVEVGATSTRMFVSATPLANARAIDAISVGSSRQTLTEAAFRALPPPAPVLTP